MVTVGGSAAVAAPRSRATRQRPEVSMVATFEEDDGSAELQQKTGDEVY
jgi:hypothetical protein